MRLPVVRGEKPDPERAECVEDLLTLADFGASGRNDVVLLDTVEILARSIAARWSDRLAAGDAGLHPVARLYTRAREIGMTVDETVALLGANAPDARSRAVARTALIALGDPVRNRLLLSFVGEGVTFDVEGQFSVDTYSWDHRTLATYDHLPEELRPLCPIEDLPAYEHFLAQEKMLSFGDRELDLLRLIDSAGVDHLALGHYDGRVVDIALQVAMFDWQVAADDDDVVDPDEVERARERFTYVVRRGGQLDVEVALSDALDDDATREVFIEALDVICKHASADERTRVLLETLDVLDAPELLTMTSLDAHAADQEWHAHMIEVVSSLRMHVDLLVTMGLGRGDTGSRDGMGLA